VVTYRERREARAAKLDEWAAKREAKQHALSEAARADEAATGIPFGQPILVGHHSERRHRNAIAKIDRAMAASVENAQTAESMRSRAAEIERQSDRAIYDDDPDAVERLTERIAELEAERERRKQANATYRREHREELKAMDAYDRHHAVPYPTYSLSNLSGNISRLRKRLVTLSQPENGRWLFTRRPDECRTCERAIEQGERVLYFKRDRAVECATCANSEPPKEVA
jgi:hypothetical protein